MSCRWNAFALLLFVSGKIVAMDCLTVSLEQYWKTLDERWQYLPNDLKKKILLDGFLQDLQRRWRPSKKIVSGHTKKINSAVFSKNSKIFASGASDGLIKIWNATDGTLIRTISTECTNVWMLLFIDGDELVSSANGQITQVWNSSTGFQIEKERMIAPTFNFYRASASLFGYQLTLFSIPFAKPVHTFDGKASQVKAVAFSPDEKMFAAGMTGNTIKIWDLATKHLLLELHGHKAPVSDVSFNVDGKILLSASEDGTMRMWDLAVDSCLDVIKKLTPMQAYLIFLAYVQQKKGLSFSIEGEYLPVVRSIDDDLLNYLLVTGFFKIEENVNTDVYSSHQAMQLDL